MSDWRLYRRLLGYVAPQWPMFFLSLAGYLVYSTGNVLLADLLQFLLDSLDESVSVVSGIVSTAVYRLFDTGGVDPVEFARMAVPVAMVVIAGTRASGFFLGNYCMNCVARGLIHRLRCELFNKMLVAPAAYYDAHKPGALISRFTFNVEQVSGAVTKALKTVVREGLTVLALAGYLLYLNWRLCLVFFAVIPVVAAVVTYVGRHFRRYSRRIQSSMGDVTQVSAESISGYREIRIFGGQSPASGAIPRRQPVQPRTEPQTGIRRRAQYAGHPDPAGPGPGGPGVVCPEPGHPARLYRRFHWWHS